MSSEPVAYNQFLYKTIPYDPEKDFQPITNLFFNTLAVVANSETKVKTFAEMIAFAKAHPGKASYATFAQPAAVFMDKLNKNEGIDIVRIPYRGGGEVVNALLGGNVQFAVLALSNMVPQLQSGRIVPLAVVANSRSPLFPDVPTLKEARGETFRRPGSDCSPRPACRGRSSRRSRATLTASWRIPYSASACTPSARSSRRPSGSTNSPASSASSASSRSRWSRNPASG